MVDPPSLMFLAKLRPMSVSPEHHISRQVGLLIFLHYHPFQSVFCNYVSRKGKINRVSVRICVSNIGHDEIKRPRNYRFITIETGLV
jgi:hypothetical protein